MGEPLKYWYVGHYRKVTENGFTYWAIPEGCQGGFDLRSIPEMALRAKSGRGVFWGYIKPSEMQGVEYLGAGSPHDIKSTDRMRDMLPQRKGKRPEGEDLAGLLRYLFTSGADPSGDEFAKPILPNTRHQLRLVSGSWNCSEWFRYGRHPHTAIVQDAKRRQYRQIVADLAQEQQRLRGAARSERAKHNRDEKKAAAFDLRADQLIGQHQRVLDKWCEQYGIDKSDRSAWEKLVPEELRKDHPGLLPHNTTYSDDFNRANSSALGPNWTEVVGNFNVSGNRCLMPAGQNVNGYCRWGLALSSDDHYSQVTVTNLGASLSNAQSRVMARAHTSAITYYLAMAWRSQQAPLDRASCYKFISGSATQIGSHVAVTIAVPQILRIEIDETDLVASWAGAPYVVQSDPSIGGNLYCGLGGVTSGSAPAEIDDWQAGDLEATGILYTQLERGLRGVKRGIWTGGANL